jgi:hypothetical protein
MKKLVLFSFFIICLEGMASAQIQGDYYIGRSLGIGRGNKYSSPNSLLEVGDTAIKKGMFIPRVIHRDSIPSPAFGLIVYDMSNNNIYYRTRSAWINISTGGGLTWGSIPGDINSQADLITKFSLKQNLLPVGTTSQYLRGNLTLATLDKNAVGLSNVLNLDQTNASNLTSGIIPAGRFGTSTIPLIALNVTGTANNTTFIRGDGQYAKPAVVWGDLLGSIVDQPDLSSALAAKESLSNKGIPNGYASLAASGRVPTAQLGTGGSNPTDVLRFDGTWGAGGSGGATDLGQSRTASSYMVTSSTGIPTTLQPATNTLAGILTASQKLVARHPCISRFNAHLSKARKRFGFHVRKALSIFNRDVQISISRYAWCRWRRRRNK